MTSKKQIVPFAFMQHPVEAQLAKNLKHTKIIYSTILVSLFISFLLLFIVKSDVTVHAGGAIKALTEKSDIKVPAEGIIDSLFIKENDYVKEGQPLLKIRAATLEQKNTALLGQHKDLRDRIHDLELLVSGKATNLLSPLYIQQYGYYRQKISEASGRYNLAAKNFDRYAFLYKSDAVSQMEYDKAIFDKNTAATEVNLVRQQQQSLWQAELNSLNNQLKDLSAQLAINEENKSQYLVKAQVSGTIQDLKGVQPGSFVAAGEALAVISPDSGLIAETYVLPKDIGFIKAGNPVRMQVDAFNYNSWGTIDGVVEAVSGDVFVSGQQPFFKVRCRLSKTTLQLKNGYTGQVKKGMTVQASFKIARRTLFQLLYDQTHDWLNSNSSTHEQSASK
jgi:membrane fusion protein, peptide pheromone/bacteriocin exporter